MDLRTVLVTCADASTMGEGMCVSSGLIARDRSCCHLWMRPLMTLNASGLRAACNDTPPKAHVFWLCHCFAVMCALTRLPCAVQGYAGHAVSALDADELRSSHTSWGLSWVNHRTSMQLSSYSSRPPLAFVLTLCCWRGLVLAPTMRGLIQSVRLRVTQTIICRACPFVG